MKNLFIDSSFPNRDGLAEDGVGRFFKEIEK